MSVQTFIDGLSVTRASGRGLPRSRRLLKPADFTTVRAGPKSSDRLFTVAGRTVGNAPARLGIAVSRRVSLKAVVRNRIKRQVRESFRLHQTEIPGLDVIVIAREQAARATNNELRTSLKQHWQRLAQLCVQH